MNTPLTKREWNDLSGKAQWDILSALRGPDFDNSTLKWFATSVIRGKMREVIRVGGMVNEDLPLIIIPSGPLPGVKDFWISHWRNHVIEAAAWLGIGRLSVPAEYFQHSVRIVLDLTIRERPLNADTIQILKDHQTFMTKMGYF